MNQYAFAVDEEARAFCDEIVEAMQLRFHITNDEALGRLNRHWRGLAFVGIDYQAAVGIANRPTIGPVGSTLSILLQHETGNKEKSASQSRIRKVRLVESDRRTRHKDIITT